MYPLSQGQVHVLSFTDSGPGADPVVLRAAYLGVAGTGGQAYIQRLISDLQQQQQPQYQAAVREVRVAGQPAVYIQFAAPAP